MDGRGAGEGDEETGSLFELKGNGSTLYIVSVLVGVIVAVAVVHT